MKAKLIYVTKKQVAKYIAYERSRLKVSEEELSEFVEETLTDLKDFPNDNANQIKFFTRVYETLIKKNKIR